MKKILIALVFLPMFAFGQVQSDEHYGDVQIDGNINVLGTETDIDSSMIPYLVTDSTSLGGQRVIYAAGDSLADIDTVRKLVNASIVDVGWTLVGSELRSNGYSIDNNNDGGDILWLNSSAVRFGNPPYSITTFDVSTSGLIELRAPYEGISIGTSGVASYTSDVSASFTGLSLVNKDYVTGLTGGLAAGNANDVQLSDGSGGFKAIGSGSEFNFDGTNLTIGDYNDEGYSYIIQSPYDDGYPFYIKGTSVINDNNFYQLGFQDQGNGTGMEGEFKLSTEAASSGFYIINDSANKNFKSRLYIETIDGASNTLDLDSNGVKLYNESDSYDATSWTDNNLITKGYADTVYDYKPAVKWHRTADITNPTASTWTDVHFDLMSADESTFGFNANADTTGFESTVDGLFFVNGCGHWNWTGGATTTVKIYIRITVNGIESKCTQSNDTRGFFAGGDGSLGYKGTVRLEVSDVVKVQFKVSNTAMDFVGSSEFDDPISFSFNAYEISK